VSLCDTCRQPGHCCNGFNLSGTDGALVFWDDDERGPLIDEAFPFLPVQRWHQWTVEGGPEVGRTYSAWLWRCTKLGSDGRCTIYETRPQLCRDYEAGSDRLCIEYVPKFKGIPIRMEYA
jgi:Fe-S-cluster containining protein